MKRIKWIFGQRREEKKVIPQKIYVLYTVLCSFYEQVLSFKQKFIIYKKNSANVNENKNI